MKQNGKRMLSTKAPGRRRFLLALALPACSWPAVAASRTGGLPADDAAAIQAVVMAQLAAFAADDAAGAFALASDNVRTQFGSADGFIAMVRNAYPVVYRPASVIFMVPVLRDGQATQAVRLSDGRGAVWIAAYLLQRQADGSWRIAGCVLTQTAASQMT